MFNAFAFLSYAFVVSFTPGPNNIMAMVYGSKKGYRKTMPFCLGVATGFFIILILSIFFNRILLAAIPKAQTILSGIGTAFLLYLAYKVSGIHLFSEAKETSGHDRSIPLNYKTGTLLQFVNPKGILYGLTVVSSFIAPHFSHYTSQIALSALLALIAFASTSSWAVLGNAFNRLLSKYQKPFNICMSLLLVYSALTISGFLH
jgi:threonine/homoserine/homoserine lactone efflux protein